VIARVSTLGEASRVLVGLTVAGDRVPEAGDALIAGEAEVGRVTSAARSPTCGGAIALAIVRKEFKEPGVALGVRPASGGELAAVRVSTLPFYRRPASETK
jgi:aminomethyltransferase